MAIAMHLSNGPNPIDRIRQGKYPSYLALHYQIEDLGRLKALTGSRGIVRYFDRDLPRKPLEQVLRDLEPVVRRMQELGLADLTIGNELNHPVEYGDGQPASPGDCARFLRSLYQELRNRYPGLRLHLPAPSPGFSGWTAYISEARAAGVPCDVVDVHSYGTLDRLIANTRDAHNAWPEKPLCVTEFNHGAGNTVDLVAYADTVKRYTEWCADQLYIDGAPHWFIWKWVNPDPNGQSGTSTSLEGSPLESFFSELNERTEQPMTSPLIHTWVQPRVFGEIDGIKFFDARDRYPEVVERPKYDGPSEYPRRPLSQIENFVVHHSGSPAVANFDEAVAAADAYQRYHVLTHGWPALGYHLVGFPGGILWTHGFEVVSYHCSNPNPTSVGLVLPGTYEYTPLQPWMKGVVVAAKKFTDGQVSKKLALFGHHELAPWSTAYCPSRLWQTDWKPKLLAALGQPAQPPANSEPDHILNGYNIGPGFKNTLLTHPEYGRPRQNAWSDMWGNTYLWCTPTPQHPEGVLLVWRKYTNEIRVVTWE